MRAVALPAYDVVSLTPNIYLTDDKGNYLLDHEGRRQAVTVSMKELANGTPQGREQVEAVLRLYSEWIDARKAEISDLPERLRQAACRHMKAAETALERMTTGWGLVCSDRTARQATWNTIILPAADLAESLPLPARLNAVILDGNRAIEYLPDVEAPVVICVLDRSRVEDTTEEVIIQWRNNRGEPISLKNDLMWTPPGGVEALGYTVAL